MISTVPGRLVPWFACVTGLAVALGVNPGAQAGRGTPGLAEPSVVLQLPAGFDTTTLHISYMLRGPFGGLVSFVSGEAGRSVYTIETSIDGRFAASIKGYALVKGYGATLFALDLPAGRESWTIALTPKRLGVVRLAGRIAWADDRRPPLNDLTWRLSYWPNWHCEYYDLIDCGLGPIPIADTRPASDDAFAFDVPDYASDPALAGFRDRGTFSLRGIDAGWNPVVAFDTPSTRGDIKVMPSYPADLVLVAKPRR